MHWFRNRREIVSLKRIGVLLLIVTALIAHGASVSVVSAQDINPPEVTVLPQALERISWGAVIAGAIIALILQLAFNLLAIGVGVSTINPQYDDDSPSPKTLGAGAIGAVLVSALISIFIGGFLAARFAGIPDNVDGLLHGIMVWGVVSLIVLFLMTTTLGRIISGVSTIISQGLHLAGSTARAVGQGAANVAQGVAHGAGNVAQGVAHGASNVAHGVSDAAQNAAQNVQQGNGSAANAPDWDQVLRRIQDEAKRLMAQAGVPVETVQEQVRGAGQDVQQAAKQALQNPTDADRILTDAINRVFQRGQDVASHADRQAVIDILKQRGNMSDEQAQQTLAQWEENANRVRQQITNRTNQMQGEARQMVDQVSAEARQRADELRREAERVAREAEAKAREVAAATTKAISRLALAAFAALLIGAIAGGVGGLIGAPEVLPSAQIEDARDNTTNNTPPTAVVIETPTPAPGG